MAAPGARADDAAAQAGKKAAAREKLVEGDGFLKQGEFQQALAAFKEAYALYPSPKIHYNFGLSYQGMGRNADALDAFEAFLLLASDAQPDVQARARTTRDILLERVGTLKVVSDVEGATIVIDGRELGKTPQVGSIHLDPGPHLLLVDGGTGASSFTQRLQVAAGVSTSVVVRLSTGAGQTKAALVEIPPPRANPPIGKDGVVPAATATATATKTEDAIDKSRGPGKSWRVAGIATAAAGALVAAGGLFFGLAARSAATRVSRQYDADSETQGKRDETLQWIGYGVGGAAIAAGVLMFVHGRSAMPDDTASARERIYAHVSPGKVVIGVRF